MNDEVRYDLNDTNELISQVRDYLARGRGIGIVGSGKALRLIEEAILAEVGDNKSRALDNLMKKLDEINSSHKVTKEGLTRVITRSLTRGPTP